MLTSTHRCECEHFLTPVFPGFTGKAFEVIKQKVAAIGEKEWKVYDNGRQKWSYTGFEYQCDKWQNAYRALYTRPKYEDRQGLLDFARPELERRTQDAATGTQGAGTRYRM